MKTIISKFFCINLMLFFVHAFSFAQMSYAADDFDSMTKEDLYKMILDLKKEVKVLKENQNKWHHTEDQVEHIVDEKMAVQEAKAANQTDRVQIHVSLSQGFLYSDSNKWLGDTDEGTFDYNEFTINTSANLTDKLRAGLQLMSRDLGDFVDNEIRIDWANMDYSWRDELGFRAGILKVPFGLYNESRDIDAARIGVMLPQGMYSENIRDLTNDLTGFSFYGALNIGAAGMLSYNMMFGNNDLETDGELAGGLMSISAFDDNSLTDIRLENVFAGALTWQTPLDGLLMNASLQHGEMTADGYKTLVVDAASSSAVSFAASLTDNSFYNYSIGFEYTLNNLILAAEYRKACLEYDYATAFATYTLDRIEPVGWYVSGSYRFMPWLATEVSYSEYWYNDNDRDGDMVNALGSTMGLYAYQKTWSLNTRFDINDYWIIKAGVNFNEGLGMGYRFQTDEDPDKHWILYQLKTTVSF